MKRIIPLLLVLCLVVALVFIGATPTGRTLYNNFVFAIQKADDATAYRTRKEVEDSCRAMIASYTADVKTYELYCESENEEKQGWAEQARMRANKTASVYNEYIMKNSFVWEDNIPDDIEAALDFI